MIHEIGLPRHRIAITLKFYRRGFFLQMYLFPVEALCMKVSVELLPSGAYDSIYINTLRLRSGSSFSKLDNSSCPEVTSFYFVSDQNCTNFDYRKVGQQLTTILIPICKERKRSYYWKMGNLYCSIGWEKENINHIK